MNTLKSSPKRRRRGSGSALKLMAQSGELGLAVPQVVAHRLTRMALAGPVPSPRDRQEFQRMFAEKSQAFAQGWQAMALQAWQVQQQLWQAWLGAAFTPWAGWGAVSPSRQVGQAWQQGLGIMAAGVAPVHRLAVANAKRLSRTRLA